jgi:glycosyltransferase involved in cell wall biosynthesis
VSRTGARVDVSLVTSGHDVADARLHRLVAALTDSGLSVQVVGLGDASTAPPSATHVSTHPRGGMAARLRDALVAPWRAQGQVVIVIDPDTVPSAWLRRLTGRRLVVDVHEDYAALLKDRAWAHGAMGAMAKAAVGVSTALARRADLTVVADSHVPPRDAAHRLVLRNLPYGGYLPEPGPLDDHSRAVHVGDLRRSRGLFDMVEAVAAAPGWTLDLVGPVAADDQAELDERLAQPDVAGRVRLHGRRPPREAWAVADGAWVGLSLLQDTPAFRDGIPSKLYEFLQCGLAVVVSPLPRQAALVEESGAGVVVDDATAAAATLRAYAAEPDLLERHRGAARAWSSGDEPDAYREFAAGVLALVRH